MLKQLKNRNLPDLLTFFDGTPVKTTSDFEKRRLELLDAFQSEMYGTLPAPPKSLTFEETSDYAHRRYCAGKATLSTVEITACLETGSFTFPVYKSVPKTPPKLTFVLINFRDNVPDLYLPVEELIDNGCATLSFCYKDITSDDNDFTNGLAGVLYPDGTRSDNSAGKIAMWAWAAMRVMDYIQTLDNIDKTKVVVIGHSRLGKTALLTSAFDRRFMGAVSNNSGCCGAASIRGKSGELYSDIYNKFPFWFCPEFKKYADGTKEIPFDQHALIALSAPRPVCVGSAANDSWADPRSEFISCVAASDVYNLYGVSGLVHNNEFPTVPSSLHEGKIAYHIREGEHYLSRVDWHDYIYYFSEKEELK